MEARVERIVAKHGAGTNVALKRQLLQMVKRDQSVRRPEYFQSSGEKHVKEQQRVDAELTAELKRIVAEYGWPTIRLVGMEASEGAALVLTHSPDHNFQRSMVPRLQQLADDEEILGSSMATIIDKILVSEGKPQRFGTQFQWSRGTAEMFPVEDLERLEERRAKYLLPPLAEYKKALGKLYEVESR